MKKKLLTLAIASALMIPCGIGLAACSGGGGGDDTKPSSMSIYVKNETNLSSHFHCAWDSIIGNKEAFVADDIKIMGHYTGDVKKEIPYALCKKTFYYPTGETGPQMEVIYEESTTPFDFMANGDTYNMTPDLYRIKFEYEGCEQSLYIQIDKGERNINSIGTYFAKWSSDNDENPTKQNVLKENGVYKFEYAYNELKSGDYFATSYDSSSFEKLQEEDFFHFVVVDNGEYEKVENKSNFFSDEEYRHLWSSDFSNYFPHMGDGSPLKPGKYLVVPHFIETEHYTSGYANPIKIEITPTEVSLRGLYVIAAPDIIYQQTSLVMQEDQSGYMSCDISYVLNLQAVIDDDDTDPSKYVSIATFSNGQWTSTLYKDIKEQEFKVHAYEEGGKYYLADYDVESGKWFKYGTETEIEANKIELVGCDDVEEYKELAHEEIMLSAIYFTIDTTLLNEKQQEIISQFTNSEGIFKKELKVVAFKP